jgi:hypothetical protein
MDLLIEFMTVHDEVAGVDYRVGQSFDGMGWDELSASPGERPVFSALHKP